MAYDSKEASYGSESKNRNRKQFSQPGVIGRGVGNDARSS